MNSEDQFERRLQRVPQRTVPPAWRSEVLRAAAQGAVSRPPVRPTQPNLLATLNDLLSEMLWPHPRAWAGLAAVWLLILGLNYTAHDPSTQSVAHRTAPLSPEIRQLLLQQEQLLAELTGPIEKPRAERPKPAATQPRSQRREEYLNA